MKSRFLLALTALFLAPLPAWAAGEVFQDCPQCPQMVEIPGGSFMMGSPASEEGRDDDEGPVRRVNIARFAVSVYEIQFADWDLCVAEGGCGGYRPEDAGWGRGRQPVMLVSWNDAQNYVEYLSIKTRQNYRLLSESEWEYAARAGTTTPLYFGDRVSQNQANYHRRKHTDFFLYSAREGEYLGRTAAVGSYPPNRFGLYDMHGNVGEWVQDCYNGSYAGAPDDGSARESGDCTRRVLRGGSWVDFARFVRSALRVWSGTGDRYNTVGFRVARTLTP